jgi:hypothetical protein
MKERLENRRDWLASSWGSLASNFAMWASTMGSLGCNLDSMVLGWVREHMLDLMVSNLETCRSLGSECTDSLPDRVKTGFRVEENKVNILVTARLHHWHPMARSLVPLELHHCPALKHYSILVSVTLYRYPTFICCK